MDENYEEQRLQVDPTPEYPERWVTFAGSKVGHTSGVLGRSEEETRYGFYTLYETAREGYRLYAVESVTDAPDDVRRPGQRAASGNTSRTLYSEEEARRKYPALFDRLLRTTED
jgi:hypothetical protein